MLRLLKYRNTILPQYDIFHLWIKVGVKIGLLQKMYNLIGQSDGMMNICIATCNQWYLDDMLINLSGWSSVDFKKESKCEVNMKSKLALSTLKHVPGVIVHYPFVNVILA